jgi:hypothetical protein
VLASTFGKASSLLQHETFNLRRRKLWVLYADFIRTSIFYIQNNPALHIFTSLGQRFEKCMGMFKRRILEYYLYDMPFFLCTDPHDASETMSHSFLNRWFKVDSSAFC